MILNRITNFENNINKLGTDISQTQMVGSALVEEIKENINAIRSKQKVAKDFAEVANKKLETYFKEHQIELKCISKRYNEALEAYLKDYEQMLQERKEELEKRKREFVEAIEQKLSIEDIRSDFSSLKRLNEISQKVELLAKNPVNGDKLVKILDGIRVELTAISASQENQNKGLWGSIIGNSNSVRETDEARKRKQAATLETENLRKKEETTLQDHQRAEEAQREKREREEMAARAQANEKREKIAMEVIKEAQQKPDEAKKNVSDDTIDKENLQEKQKSFWHILFHKKQK